MISSMMYKDEWGKQDILTMAPTLYVAAGVSVWL